MRWRNPIGLFLPFLVMSAGLSSEAEAQRDEDVKMLRCCSSAEANYRDFRIFHFAEPCDQACCTLESCMERNTLFDISSSLSNNLAKRRLFFSLCSTVGELEKPKRIALDKFNEKERIVWERNFEMLELIEWEEKLEENELIGIWAEIFLPVLLGLADSEPTLDDYLDDYFSDHSFSVLRSLSRNSSASVHRPEDHSPSKAAEEKKDRSAPKK